MENGKISHSFSIAPLIHKIKAINIAVPKIAVQKFLLEGD